MPNDTALGRIQHAARFGQILLSKHAREEMENARVQARDVQRAILSASVALAQPEGVYRLEGGTAIDGEELIVVLREIRPGLFVITVF